MVVVVMVMMMLMMVMMVCGVVGWVVTDELKGPILCWTRSLTRIPNSKFL